MDGQIRRGHDTYTNPARTRIACVWLPRFGLRLASRLDPLCQTGTDNERGFHVSRDDGTGGGCTEDGDGMGRVALFRPGTRWQELLECSDDLEAEGVVPGTPLKEAQSRHPDARYLPCDPPTLEAIREAFGTVVTALAPYSPVIEPALGVVPGVAGTTRDAVPVGVHVDPARAVIFLDVAGLEARYGPEDDLAHHLADTVSQASGGMPPLASVRASSPHGSRRRRHSPRPHGQPRHRARPRQGVSGGVRSRVSTNWAALPAGRNTDPRLHHTSLARNSRRGRFTRPARQGCGRRWSSHPARSPSSWRRCP